MNQESPFESYLSGRAADIEVPGVGVTAIADRARARRRRRRAGSAAVLGVAVLLGGAVVGQGLRSDDEAQEIASYGASLGAPVLDWTVVDVGNGLGWTKDIVRADSGTLYGLSTAAGSGDGPDAYRPVVYGSSDGSEWTVAEMPEGIRVNSLAASGDTIYAVGTAGAGGTVRLATSESPTSGWSTTDLPLDLDAESVGLPGRLYVAEVGVASTGGSTVVAASVVLKVDTEALVAGEENPSEWYPERDGMVRWVCEVGNPGAQVSATSMPRADLTEDEQAELDAYLEREASAAAGSDPGADLCGDSARQVKTWAELGVDPAVGDLVAGEVRLFASAPEGSGDPDGGHSFAPVGSVPASYGVEVLAGDDGFWVLSPALNTGEQPRGATEARYSPDGVDWSAEPSILDGDRVASGVLDGALHVVTVSWPGGTVQLHRLGVGTTSSLDLSDVVGLSDDRYFAAADIGPLGVALVTNSGTGQQQVLHSADGSSYGRVDVPRAPDGKKQSINGITMSADAVKVRLNLYPAGDTAGGPPEAQRLFVGTPR